MDALHAELREEFDLYSALGVKFCMGILKLIAQKVMYSSENPAFSSIMIDPLTDQQHCTQS